MSTWIVHLIFFFQKKCKISRNLGSFGLYFLKLFAVIKNKKKVCSFFFYEKHKKHKKRNPYNNYTFQISKK